MVIQDPTITPEQIAIIRNAFYAAGMLLGPPVSSVLFERFSGAGMLAHLAVLWLAFAVFGLVYAKDDPAAARA